jgi:hypothetical protein
MNSPEPHLSDLVLRIDAAVSQGREAELLAELEVPVGREDQLDAARDDLLAGLLTMPEVNHRNLGFGEQPGWLRLGIMMAVARWLDGQTRSCPHHPTAQHPEPVHLALWLPDLVVCEECVHLLVAPAHPSCAGCGVSAEAGDSAGPRLVIVVAGFVAIRVFACADCMPPHPEAS